MYIFFFKQKTAYEMRISDWSSDVCSSDLVHPEDFAAFIHDDRHPCFMGRASKRTFVRRAVDDDRRPERLGEPERVLVMAVDPDLRQVAAMDRGTVEVNAAITPRDHLVEEDISELRRQRPFGAAGDAAVEIAAVGQVAAVADEAEEIGRARCRDRVSESV